VKPYQDENDEGNSEQHQNDGVCVVCGKSPRGTVWSPYFCFECNVERMDRITKNLEDMAKE
jgi:hypothetical protein